MTPIRLPGTVTPALLGVRSLDTALFGGGWTPPLANGHSRPLPASSRRLLKSAVKPAHSKAPLLLLRGFLTTQPSKSRSNMMFSQTIIAPETDGLKVRKRGLCDGPLAKITSKEAGSFDIISTAASFGNGMLDSGSRKPQKVNPVVRKDGTVIVTGQPTVADREDPCSSVVGPSPHPTQFF